MQTAYYKLAHTLVIDDNAQDAHLIELALAGASVAQHVTVATSYGESLTVLDELAAARETFPDLILLGLNAPNVEGLEILAEIKRQERLRGVPVLVLTSSLAASVLERAYVLHANCCIHKRNTPEELFAAIDSACRFWLQTVALPHRPWWA